jgi:hypothetical protein
MFIVYLFGAAIYRFKFVLDKFTSSYCSSLSVCLSVCLRFCLPACVSVCLPVPACLPVYRLYVCLPAYLSVDPSVRPFSLSVREGKNIFAREEEDNRSKTGPSIVVRTSPSAINKDK